MRLVTFQKAADSTPLLGAMTADDEIVDLQEQHRRRFGQEKPELASMLALIEGGLDALQIARDLLKDEVEALSLGSGVRLLAPLPVPPQIRDSMTFLEHLENVMDGRNRREGLAERTPQQRARIDVFKRRPSWYKCNRFSVIGTDQVVTWPRYSEFADYEHELGCVLWKGGKDIAVSDAESHIFGYVNFNDLSARDVQPDENGSVRSNKEQGL